MNLDLPRAGNWHGKASLLMFLESETRAFAADDWSAKLAPPPFTPEMLVLDRTG